MDSIIGITAVGASERPVAHSNVLWWGSGVGAVASSPTCRVVSGTNRSKYRGLIDDARAVAFAHWVEIDRCLVMPETNSFKIDWGGSARGQGKRSGGMVKGSMSSPLYVREYQYLDLSEYVDDLRSEVTARVSKYMTSREAMLYYSARKYGLNNVEAMALCKNFDKWKSESEAACAGGGDL